MFVKFWLIAVAASVWMVSVTHKLAVPSSTPLPRPTPTISTTVQLGGWQYPGSTPAGDQKWASSDAPQKITDWYKSKIESTGMKAKSFVQTNTNGNVLNKLVVANGNSKISVEISKSSADSQTLILVVPLDKLPM